MTLYDHSYFIYNFSVFHSSSNSPLLHFLHLNLTFDALVCFVKLSFFFRNATKVSVSIVTPFLQVYFKQKCQNCKSPINPYRVWNLQCADCGLDRDECECICIYCEEHRYDCTCDLEDETAPEKPHRRDLCMKCLAGFPCITESDDQVPRRRRRRRRRRR